MSAEDEDLMALRSAALASLSAKPPKKQKEEEDLDALRLAALMTRKNNQKIQVIQHPIIPQMPPMHPPPLFWNPWNTRSTANLISLTPDPSLVKSPPVHRPLKQTPPQKPQPAAPPEAKVPDKFSRYNSDSSSEDDEENHGKQKPAESDEDAAHSDAESVKSEKSFSSISEKDEQEPVKTNEKVEEETKDKESVSEESNQSDDNISIIDDEEDDILAQIDDFLEDRPKKEAGKKEKKKKPKDDPEKQLKKKESDKPHVHENKEKRLSPVRSKRSKNAESSNTERRHLTKTRSREDSDREKRVKNQKPDPAEEKQVSRTTNQEHREKATKYPNKSNEDRLSRKTNDPKTRAPRGKEDQQRIPVISRSAPLPPGSPPRQRRDSDLDSVGTSDLSFLASDSDDEKKKMKEIERKETKSSRGSDRKRPLPKRKAPSGPERANRYERAEKNELGKENNRKRREKERKNEKEERSIEKDLRKKLETKGLKKKTAEPTTKRNGRDDLGVKNQEDKSRSKESLARKTGILDLKRKSSRIPEKSRSRSSSKESSRGSEISEARRIIITRPNSSVQSSATSNDSKERDDSTKESAKNRVKITKKLQRDNPKEIEYHSKETVSERKTHILPPEKETEKRLSNPESRKKLVRVKERHRSPEEKSESASSEEEELIQEEVFAFDDAALPQFDDLLGNVAEDDEPRFPEPHESTQRYSGGQTKKRKRRVSTAEKLQTGADRRRIIPKSSSGGEGMDKAKNKANPTKSVYLRLGVVETRPKSPESLEKDCRHFHDQSSSVSDETLPRSKTLNPNSGKPRTVSSKIRSKRSWSDEESEEEDGLFERESFPKEEKTHISNKRKRKIKISSQSTVRSFKDPEGDRKPKNSSKPQILDIHERLGRIARNGTKKSEHGTSRDEEDFRRKRTDKKRRTSRGMQRGAAGIKRSKEDVLEERIRRITEQNGLIKKRQREIELEKKQFGC